MTRRDPDVQARGTNGAPPLARMIVAAALATSFAVIVYAALSTADAAPETRVVVSSLGVCALVSFVALGWVSPARASSGFGTAVYELIPRVVGWASSSPRNAVVAVLVAGIASGGALKIGPGSLSSVSVICGDAVFLSAGGGGLDCSGMWSTRRWSPDWVVTGAESDIECIAADGKQRWAPQRLSEITYGCGKRPRDPHMIKAGVDLTAVDADTVPGRRTITGVEDIRAHLSETIPERNVKDNLLVATWNIRDFDSRGRRLDESFYYIAEIISHFDLVAVQEVIGDLGPLDRLRSILGDNWDVVVSAEAPGKKGRRERLAYLFDTRKVDLGRFISSIVILGAEQLARPPYAVAFRVGELNMLFCNVHIFWGHRSKQRLAEIARLVEYLAAAQSREGALPQDVILIGAVNATKADGKELNLIREAGFDIDSDLAALATNYRLTQPHDQIAVLSKTDRLKIGRFGVYYYYDHVFRDDHEVNYRVEMGEKYLETPNRPKYYDNWRTYQMSDHIVKWAEFRMVD